MGIRGGRRRGDEPAVGDAIDWWRVEAYEPNRRLVLRAETRLPGRAWLELGVEPTPHGCEIRQTLTFEPSGRLGQLYWLAVLPLHAAVFEGMIDGIARSALEASG